MQCQICRDGRCFCLDPFPQDLHEQLIACLWLCRGPLFGINGLPDILQWQIADISRCELDKSSIDIFDDVLNSSDINIAQSDRIRRLLFIAVTVNLDRSGAMHQKGHYLIFSARNQINAISRFFVSHISKFLYILSLNLF